MYLNSNLNINCILTITQGVLSIAIFNIYKNERRYYKSDECI